MLPSHSALPTGVGSRHRSIHRQIPSFYQTIHQTPPHDLFKHFQKHSRLTKTSVPILRKRCVVWNLLLEVQPSEPTIGQVHPDFFQQAPLAANPVEISHQQQTHDGHHKQKKLGSDPSFSTVSFPFRMVL